MAVVFSVEADRAHEDPASLFPFVRSSSANVRHVEGWDSQEPQKSPREIDLDHEDLGHCSLLSNLMNDFHGNLGQSECLALEQGKRLVERLCWRIQRKHRRERSRRKFAVETSIGIMRIVFS